MPITELPTTAPTSLGPDKIDKRVYAGEPYKFQAFLINKIRQYLIDIGGTVGLSNGTTPGSVIARLMTLEAGATSLRETSGPTTLTLGSIPDGTFLRRVGSTVSGAAGSGSADAHFLYARPINDAVAPTAGQILSYNAVDNRWDYTDPVSNVSMFTFAPGALTPGPGVHTTWTTLSAALAAARALYPSLTLTVLVDSVAVGYVVDVPSGSYAWDNVTFVSSYALFNFKAGAVVTAFDGVEFNGITLTTDATTGSPAFTAYGPGSTVNTLTFREVSGLTDGGAGTIPVMRSVAGVGGLYFIFTGGAGMYQSGPSAPAVVDANGGPLYFYLEDNTYIESRCVGNAVGTPVALVMYASPSADHSGSSSFALAHPLWTAGTVTVQMFSEGRRVAFTPDGNITETNVQDAIVGVRNRAATRSFYFAPGKAVPAANEITTWTALQTALTAAGADTIKHVYVDGSSVAYNISVPSGTYSWNETRFHGDDSVFVFQTGAVVSDFYGVTFERISVMTAATTGLSPMTCPAGYGRSVTFVGQCNLYSSAAGEIPVIDIPTGAGGITLTLQEGATVNGNGTSAPVRVTGTNLYLYTYEDSSVDARGIMSADAGSTVYFYLVDPAGQTKTGTSFTSVRPLWTAGTVNVVLSSIATNVAFTPSGTLAATNVGAALVELDTEKVAGPGTVTDRAIVTFNGTSGTAIQNNTPTIDASGNLLVTGARLRTGNGTVGSPAISPTGDTNTGTWYPGADIWSVATGGIERLRVDASGNVGIGLTPATRLGVHSGAVAGTAIAAFQNNVGTAQLFVSTATPEGAITANIGDLCVDTAGGGFYQKKTGTGTNTGWQAVGAGASASLYRILASGKYSVVSGFTGVDITVGGFVFQPGSESPIKFEAYGNFTGTFTAYLYSVGTPGGGGATPVLRSTLSVTMTNNYGAAVQTLTPTASPGTNANQISTAETFYEVRINASTTGTLLYAGLKCGTSGS